MCGLLLAIRLRWVTFSGLGQLWRVRKMGELECREGQHLTALDTSVTDRYLGLASLPGVECSRTDTLLVRRCAERARPLPAAAAPSPGPT